MYRKDSVSWLKHYDFILLDMLCLQIAFVLSYLLSGYGLNPYKSLLYRNMAIFIEFADVVVMFMFGSLKGVLKKGYYKSFVVTLKQAVAVGVISVFYLFLIQEGQNYSRLSLIYMIVLYTGITYIVREIRKNQLRKKMVTGGNRTLLIVTSKDAAETVIENMKENN